MGHVGDIALAAGVSFEETPCPRITELASGAITAADTIAIELVETDGQPTVMIIRWPADAHTVQAAIKAGRRL